jgi:hypothetical protein
MLNFSMLVIPAQAGIQIAFALGKYQKMDSRLRGNDGAC